MLENGSPQSPYHAALASLRGGLWAALGLSATISLLMLTGSIYMQQVYNRVLTSGSVPTLISLFAIVVVLHGFLVLYDGLRMRLLSRLALRLDRALACSVFEADLAVRQGAAPTAPPLGPDLDLVRSTLSGPGMLALFDLPFTVIFLTILFLIHPVLGGLTVLGMALAAALALLNRKVLMRPMAAAHETEARQRRFAEGARHAAATVAALGMTGAVRNRWHALQTERLVQQQQGFEPSEALSAASRGLRMLLQSALLTAAAWLVIDNAISSGAIVASSILSGRALGPVDQIIGQWRNIAAARAAHARLGAAPLRRRAAQLDLPPITGALEVRGLVRLRNPETAGQDSPERILDGISFSLTAGEGLGIAGASGGGKSTLARLLVGALQPDGGEIRFDGATASQWDPDRLGRQIGYLPQRVDLLPGTVRDNISRFDPAATDAAVIEAAKAAGVHEMILRLPAGYGTELGEREPPLSGGQIQRIGLARALYGAPRLLVLDEPNAHLDQAGEAALARCLAERRAAGVTVIILAHRAGALAAVDRLMVLEDGQIVQDGPRDMVLTLLTGAARPGPKVTIRNLAAEKTGLQPGDTRLMRHSPAQRVS